MKSKYTNARARTGKVISLTIVTMIIEIVAGFMTGSMALLADGWHMATHVGALSITWAGYYLVDHPKFRQKFTFGGGKVLVLGAYTSAILLLVTAGWMFIESISRLINPEDIFPKEAMIVTAIGLVVNLLSMWLLGTEHHGHDHGEGGHSHDLNMASAYAHVLADALTSVLALLALAGALWMGWTWLDPVVGVIGAIMISKWGIGLVKQSSHELLDAHASRIPPGEVESFLSGLGLKASCLHVWQIDGQKVAMHVRVAAGGNPLPTIHQLRQNILDKFAIDHLVIEMSATDVQCSLDEHEDHDHDHDHAGHDHHGHGKHEH